MPYLLGGMGDDKKVYWGFQEGARIRLDGTGLGYLEDGDYTRRGITPKSRVVGGSRVESLSSDEVARAARGKGADVVVRPKGKSTSYDLAQITSARVRQRLGLELL